MDDAKVEDSGLQSVENKVQLSVDDIASSVLRHDKDLKRSIDDIAAVSDYVLKTKSFRLLNDKDLVIIGTVAIAVVAMFVIPEPVTIITNVIAGLFGLATGRALGNKDNNG